MKQVYITFGCGNEFKRELFNEIKNPGFDTGFLNKPGGGLWSSPIDSELSWENWCKMENFQQDTGFSTSFKFTLKDNARVYKINSMADLQILPMVAFNTGSPLGSIIYTDFETVRNTWDAIHLTINGLRSTGNLFLGDYETCGLATDIKYKVNLYSWDCETLLVLNPDIVEPDNSLLLESLDIIWQALLDIGNPKVTSLACTGIGWRDLPKSVAYRILDNYGYLLDTPSLINEEKYRKLILDYWNS